MAEKNLVNFLDERCSGSNLWNVQLDGNSDFSDIADNHDIFLGDSFGFVGGRQTEFGATIDIATEDGRTHCNLPADGFIPINPSICKEYEAYLQAD